MNSSEIRKRFLDFFAKRGHAVIPSASLVTSDEKGETNATLFNTAGMQPLVPYLLGKPHPNGNRLVDVQKCLRTVDIDDIGDKTHATFFEMLGNWSLGDYFKKEAINWSYEFLTSKEEGLGLDPNRLYVSVFKGDENAPRDDEAAAIWREIFKKNSVNPERIYFLGTDKNWWEAGENGPCGPDTEMYYDVSNIFKGRALSHDEFVKADEERVVVEVWNDVFMQYKKENGRIVGNLPKPSVDTGAGLERLAMTMQGKDNIYDTDLLKPLVDQIKGALTLNANIRSIRIVADHLRASAFLISDGVIPNKNGRGYVLRRLIRGAAFNLDVIGYPNFIEEGNCRLPKLVEPIIKVYKEVYKEVAENESKIKEVILVEEKQFRENLKGAFDEIVKIRLKQEDLAKTDAERLHVSFPANDAFKLYTSHGIPFELIWQIAEAYGFVQIEQTKKELVPLLKAHQDLSRAGAEQKFKGGLADANDPMVVRYHTATHLLHQALHDVLGDGDQKGSNITKERLRFDFMHGAKMTDEEKKKVEDIVNSKIYAKLPVQHVVLPRDEAEKTGARHFFGEKYGDQISVYFIGNDMASAYSKEFCGGPHVANTSELAGPEGKWKFKIQKEEAVSQGVRRIKAVLE